MADVHDPDAWAAHARGTDAVSHQAAMVGLGVDMGDVRRYVDDNDAGTAASCSGRSPRRVRGRGAGVSSMVVYGEGRSTCAVHGPVRPPPRPAGRPGRGRWSSHAARGAAPTWNPGPMTRTHRADPATSTPPPSSTRSTSVAAWARERRPARRGAPLPQRLRAAAARRHALRRRRRPVRQRRLAAGRAPLVFEDGGQQRDFVTSTTSPGPTPPP